MERVVITCADDARPQPYGRRLGGVLSEAAPPTVVDRLSAARRATCGPTSPSTRPAAGQPVSSHPLRHDGDRAAGAGQHRVGHAAESETGVAHAVPGAGDERTGVGRGVEQEPVGMSLDGVPVHSDTGGGPHNRFRFVLGPLLVSTRTRT